MAISVEHSDDAAGVLGRAGAFLEGRPVEHNLILSLLRSRARHPEPGRYWMVLRDGEVVGVGFHSPFDFPATVTPMPAATAQGLAAVIAADGVRLPGVSGVAPTAAAFAGTWAERTKSPVRPFNALRIYEMGEPAPPLQVGGNLRLATPADRDLLVDWMGACADEMGDCMPAPTGAAIDRRLAGGCLWLWEDSGPVSLAGHSDPVVGVARLGPVYTPPDHRKRGYAGAVVGAVSSRLLDCGNRCILYADLANPVSNSVYRRLGFRPVAETLSYRFG